MTWDEEAKRHSLGLWTGTSIPGLQMVFDEQKGAEEGRGVEW